MAQHKKAAEVEAVEMTGMERLSLRISSMINHPVAQTQRWVVIHRLETDGDLEWWELLAQLSETDDLDMTHQEDGTVLLEWEALSDDDLPLHIEELDSIEEAAAF